jgi:histidinol phosphatase-like PHP family hydrolase
VDGQLDLSADEARAFDLVLAAPHSRLRKTEDQTRRMVAAVSNQAVRILAHPRGRITGSRAGIVAQWDEVFGAAGCSDVHTTAQLAFSETAIAHARLAGIPTDRIVNCWPLQRLQAWMVKPG